MQNAKDENTFQNPPTARFASPIRNLSLGPNRVLKPPLRE